MQKNNAFSLVELSIVLVILGLLVGGILAGQSLIRAAELRAISTEFNKYKISLNAFRDKYMAIPGDMANAQSFWGSATCPGTSATPATGTATCNGDGNFQISMGATTANENFRFWQHLSNAGLIDGQYVGVANSTTYSDNNSRLGWNVPLSKFPGAAWCTNYWGTYDVTSVAAYVGSYGNVIMIGAPNTGSGGNNWPNGALLTGADMWNVDTKMDDGKPGVGTLTARESDANCTDTAASATVAGPEVSYVLNNSTAGCTLVFKSGY